MNPLARELNDDIAATNPHVLDMLSELGRELYFPKGILTQSAEAKEWAHRYNATIGTAMEDGVAMNLPSVMEHLDGISPNEALLYAPSQGLAELRQEWLRKTLLDNPDLVGRGMSLPVVTNGLTHGLSLVAELFLNPGDVLLLPDMIWGNYRLIFQVRRQAALRQYPFFRGQGMDTPAFREALLGVCRERGKVVVLLNFPNNPSGYTPDEEEADAVADALVEAAESGANVVAVTDDAYYGLFFDDSAVRQSLFTKLVDRHPRLLAVKADAATKEVYVWGLRVGFLAFAAAGVPSGSPLYTALEKKTSGAIRGTISNASMLSQKIVCDALRRPDFFEQRRRKAVLMKNRADEVKRVLEDPRFAEAWTPYPFNSGYFMCLRIHRINAEDLRLHALRKHGVGTISVSDTDLRIAFSCLEVHQIRDLFEILHQAWRELAP
ncbi:MAG: aminotransferase class I/II-fold pyridoxal phosphate-dependent enzyme [Lentisphaeria bacterium]|nr:aminotransferase class I/II-fold pyridoxal phosphate-dependent enzyme [Lentisphaeria bacterium]